jgi:endonuclease YncB( thermonuclease family)
LEREATDRVAEDVLLRDVWITVQNGNRALVAARLLEAGAGTPVPAAPDTRYQAWLAASAALARSNNAGLWGACADATPSAAATSNDAPQLTFMSAGWRDRFHFGR